MAGGDAPDGFADDFFEQMLSAPGEAVFVEQNLGGESMGLQLGFGGRHDDGSVVSGGGFLDSISMAMQLGLKPEDALGAGNASSSVVTGLGGSPELTNLFPSFGQLQAQGGRFPIGPPPAAIRPQQPLQSFHSQSTPGGVAGIRPRVRARRGQATDPHSIAERLRRERIADRMKALQELVPSANKADRASMLDDIVDYVKFLRLQVKVLSMSRVGAAGAVAQLVADVPLSSTQGEEGGNKNQKHGWENLGGEGMEEEVAKLMEEDVGAAMQLLQSKSLCIMPISLASAIFPSSPLINPHSNSSP